MRAAARSQATSAITGNPYRSSNYGEEGCTALLFDWRSSWSSRSPFRRRPPPDPGARRARRPVPRRRSRRSPTRRPSRFPSRSAPRIIVGVEPGADLDAVAAELRPYSSSLRILRAVGEVSLRASNGAAVADRAAHDRRIAFAEPDRTLSAQADQFDSIDPATGILYDWQYDAVQAGPAIAAVGGGSSTIVAIVDSGIDVNQPDLAGRILPGYDATGTDGTVTDNVGHGTFVAGLVSMVDGNGIGGKGIAGATNVMPIRASVDSGFRENVTIAGIIWAADHGAGVINLSLGGSNDDPALDRAIDYATAQERARRRICRQRRGYAHEPHRLPRRLPRRRRRRLEHRPVRRRDDAEQPDRDLLDAQRARLRCRPGRGRQRLRQRRLLHPSGEREHRVGHASRRSVQQRPLLDAGPARAPMDAGATARARASPRRSSRPSRR